MVKSFFELIVKYKLVVLTLSGIIAGIVIGIFAISPFMTQVNKFNTTQQAASQTQEISFKPVIITQEQQKQIGLVITKVKYREMKQTITVPATIIPNDTLNVTMTAKVSGRIVSSSNLQKGDIVRIGQEIYRIYSPQLILAQQEYLDSLSDKSPFGKELQEASYNRLMVLGLSSADIDKLAQTRIIIEKFPVKAQYSGAIVTRYIANDAWVNIGDKVFDMIDTQLLAAGEVYEGDAHRISIGDSANLKINDQNIPVTISYIGFESNQNTHTISVRGIVSDSSLRPNEYGQMEISLQSHAALAIPKSSIVRAGSKTIVYIKEDDENFAPAVVMVSDSPDKKGYVEVIDGLFEGDEVVSEGAFYLYSQSKLAQMNKSMAGMMETGNVQKAKGYELNKMISADGMNIKGYFEGGRGVGNLGSDKIVFEITDSHGMPLENLFVSNTYTMDMEGMAINKTTLKYQDGKYTDNLNLAMAGPWHSTLEIKGKKYTFVFEVK